MDALNAMLCIGIGCLVLTDTQGVYIRKPGTLVGDKLYTLILQYL